MLGSRKKLVLAVALVGGLVVAGILLPVRAWTEAFLGWVEDLGAWGPAIFVLVYAVVVVALLPTWWLSIGAGILFGSGPGLAFALLGAGGGGVVAFLLGRTVMGETARGWIDAHPRLQAVDREIERRGWLAALLLRLSPLTPWNVLNYVLGVTRISARGYLASLPAGLPVLSLYVFLGSTMGSLAAPGDREPRPFEWILIGVGIASTIGVTAWLVRVSRSNPRSTGAGP